MGFENQYFTIRAVEPSTVKFSYSNNHYYSTDSGTTWSLYTANQGISLDAGETVMFKCVYNSSTSTEYSFSATTGNIEVEGNPMSFVYGDNFIGQTTHKAGAYRGLFQACTALTSCENLDFTNATMGDRTCDAMFDGCTNLVTAMEALPSPSVDNMSYFAMFKGCSKLENAPIICATTMSTSACTKMFRECTSLTTVPEDMLPATTMGNYCYNDMFAGCTSLTKSPVLPATALTTGAYWSMFDGCTSLNEITCLATNISASNATTNWVRNVASTGTFHKNMDKVTIWERGIHSIPVGWDVAENDNYFTVVAESTGTVKTNIGATYASVNGGAWTNIGTNAINVNVGDEIRYEMSINPSDGSYAQFKGSTAQFHIKGDIQSLNYGVNYKNQTVTKNYAFKALFSECTGLTRADELIMPSSSARTQSMRHMFSSCTNLTKAPELPATAVGASGYSYMFNGCTSLTTAPEIEAETVGDYAMHWMFGGCSSLTKAPSILPATATTTACYQNMFEGCTSLTKSPILPAQTVATYAYHRMFSGDTSLSEITCLATNTGASNAVSSWVTNVAPTGTFIGNKNMISWTRGNNGIPTSWTYEDYEFELTFIDLGLPSGTLWCRNNVGAKSACAYGNYYQYGKGARTFQETSGETDYNGHTTFLPASADTATATYGNGCCMPTKQDLMELQRFTTSSTTTVNGVSCFKFTSKTDSSKFIYVGKGGYLELNGQVASAGTRTTLWTQTQGNAGANEAIVYDTGHLPIYSDYRYWGCNVRAVKHIDPITHFIDLGLPSGTLWADRNLGALSSINDQGGYYKLMNGDNAYYYGQSVGSLTDAATAVLGNGKYTPTKEQFDELFQYTTKELVTKYQGGYYGGILYTSIVNGNTLFFPAGGRYATDGSFDKENVQVTFVTSTPSTSAGYGTDVYGDSTANLVFEAVCNRNYGLAVRPVMKNSSKLYLGDINIENMYLGDLRPTAYLGDTLVYG